MHNINEQALVKLVFTHYHDSLMTSERARLFLNEIGFGDPHLIKQLHLGFSDRSLGFELLKRNTPSGAAVRGALRGIGLLKSSGHELLRGCVVFPLIDDQKLVVGGYAFRIEAFEKSGSLEPVCWVLNRPWSIQ